MTFPFQQYESTWNEAAAIVRDRDAKGRNEALGFFDGFPHGHTDVSFELWRRVGRILGAERKEELTVARADAIDLVNYAMFYVMILDHEEELSDGR